MLSASIASTFAVVSDAAEAAKLQQTFRIGARSADVPSAEMTLTVHEIYVGVVEKLVRLKSARTNEVTPDITAFERLLLTMSTTEWHAIGASPCTVDETLWHQLRVYHDAWKRGYFVASATKFGGDFLLYNAFSSLMLLMWLTQPDLPSRSHAVALVLVKRLHQSIPSIDIVSHGRIAAMVKKKLLLATVCSDGVVQYITLSHALLASRTDQ
ncbi:TPA: hypothetical protein N0F65_004506 [Lagenidium giganteum]|uniref:tRNA-intron lyase n=1 Tax=Lagenidium giganteum TaxID=4803 RepID=A0AAV2YXI9_9STRA|nr:TPA: hypothetical protein N0F65_004506 [Lagenidium giganteum]